MQDRKRSILLLILLSAAVLRLWNIDTVPQWDYDEGTIMNISWNLLHGKLLLFNLTYPFIPHPPFLYLVTSALIAVFGYDLVVLRVFIALCSIATVYCLYRIGKEMSTPWMGLLIAFLYAIYPYDIFFSRMGFANNLVALLSVAALFFFIKYRKEGRARWLYYTSALTGLAIVTEYIAIAIYASLVLLLWVRDRKHLIKVSLISLAPLAIFTAYMLAVMPGAFLTDFSHQFIRLRDWEGSNLDTSSNLLGLLLLALFILAIYRLKDYLTAFYRQSLWYFISLIHPGIDYKASLKIAWDTLFIALLSLNAFIAAASFWPYSDGMFFNGLQDYYLMGIIGLPLLAKGRFRNVIAAFFLTMFLLVVKVNRFDHMMLLLYPYFCIGLASLIYRLFDYAKSLNTSKAASALVLLLLAYPFAFIIAGDASAFILGKGMSSQDIQATLAAADYINHNTNDTDIVITDDHTMRFINARTSDYVHCFIIDHKRIVYEDANLGPERFVFNSSYRNAKYFVIHKSTDRTLSDLEMQYPDISDVLSVVRRWPAHIVGNYTIYRNPEL